MQNQVQQNKIQIKAGQNLRVAVGARPTFVCERSDEEDKPFDATCFTLRSDWRDVAAPLKEFERTVGANSESPWVLASVQGLHESDAGSWLGGPLAWGKGRDVFGFVAAGVTDCVLGAHSFQGSPGSDRVDELAALFAKNPSVVWTYVGSHCVTLLLRSKPAPIRLRLAVDTKDARTALAAIAMRWSFPHLEGVLTADAPLPPAWRRLAQNLGFGQGTAAGEDLKLVACNPAFGFGADVRLTQDVMTRGALLPPKIAAEIHY